MSVQEVTEDGSMPLNKSAETADVSEAGSMVQDAKAVESDDDLFGVSLKKMAVAMY